MYPEAGSRVEEVLPCYTTSRRGCSKTKPCWKPKNCDFLLRQGGKKIYNRHTLLKNEGQIPIRFPKRFSFRTIRAPPTTTMLPSRINSAPAEGVVHFLILFFKINTLHNSTFLWLGLPICNFSRSLVSMQNLNLCIFFEGITGGDVFDPSIQFKLALIFQSLNLAGPCLVRQPSRLTKMLWCSRFVPE